MSNCECLTTYLAKVEENLKSQLSEKEAATFECKWQNSTIILEKNSLVSAVVMPVAYEYQKFKKSGEPHKNTTKGDVGMRMSYCPLCGGSLKSEAKEQAA